MFDLSTPSFDELEVASKDTSTSAHDGTDVVSEYLCMSCFYLYLTRSFFGDGYFTRFWWCFGKWSDTNG